MLRKIKLYGRLAKFVGHRVLEADIATAAEAVRFLVANFPHLEKHMADQYYKVIVGKDAIDAEELHFPTGRQEVRIVPVMGGAGGGVGKIIAGVALVALAIAAPYLGAAAAWSGLLSYGTASVLFGATAATLIGGIGASLILGGVAQLLTPVPKLNQKFKDESDPRESYSFSGIQNVSRQGVAVPVIFGEILCGSAVISASTDIDQVVA